MDDKTDPMATAYLRMLNVQCSQQAKASCLFLKERMIAACVTRFWMHRIKGDKLFHCVILIEPMRGKKTLNLSLDSATLAQFKNFVHPT